MGTDLPGGATPAVERTSGYEPALPRIALVGVGALGSALCGRLLAAGAREVLLIDPDTLAPENLPLSPLFAGAVASGRARLSQPKAEVVAALAAARRPALRWQAAVAEIADIGLARLVTEADILVSATDNALARLETAFAARTLDLPMLDGGVRPGDHGEATSSGRIAFFPPGRSAACYACGLAESRRAEMLVWSTALTLGCRAPAEAVPFSGQTGAAPILDLVAEAMFSALVNFSNQCETPASSWARIIRALPDHPHLLPRGRSCPWHELPRRSDLWEPAPDQPLDPQLESLAPGQAVDLADLVDLPWPICTEAVCRGCGAHSEPMRRLALVRRRMACPVCAAEPGSLEPMASIASLHAGHPLAKKTPRQLGLPDRHLLTKRRRLLWPAAPGS